MKKFFKPKDIAIITKIPLKVIYKFIKDGIICHIKIKNQIYISNLWLKEFLTDINYKS